MPKHHLRQDIAAPSLVDAVFGAFASMRMPAERIALETVPAGTCRHYPKAAAYFHHVDGAACTLHVRGQSALTLHPGELVFLPHGTAHRLECSGVAENVAGAPAVLTSGIFQFASPYGSGVAGLLPPVQRVAAQDGAVVAAGESSRWLAATIEAIRTESQSPSLGSALMLSHLVDLLFVWALRHWLATSAPRPQAWVAPLQDPVISKALALLHAAPEKTWSVTALAAQLHQSRSAFSQRFVALVGEPPIQYLARWRMRLAADLLASSDLRVSQIAQRVGYRSESAFSRTFHRHFGTTPIAHRRSGGMGKLDQR